MITALDISILQILSKYYCLCRPQIQQLCFPDLAKDGRAVRARLLKLCKAGLIQRTKSLIAYRGGSAGTPAWYLTRPGVEILSEWFDNPSYLAVNTRAPRLDALFHWLAIGDTHIAIERAVARQSDVSLDQWVNEWQVCDNQHGSSSPRFYLHTVFREQPNPLSCSPDAGMLLGYAGQQLVWYLEQDRNTSGVRHIAATKVKGYAELAHAKVHRKHFPDTTLDRFGVLMVTTHAGRRNALARAVKEHDKSKLWLFVCEEDLTPESFPFGDVFYGCDGVAGPLIRNQKGEEEAA